MAKARRIRLALIAVLAVGLTAGSWAGWQWAIHWAPDRARYPVQGVWLDADNGPVEWRVLKATGPGGHGADFAYLTASNGAGARDPAFAAAFDAARAAGLQVGAVHVYDLCAPADAQANNFVTTVARDRRMLPAAVAIDEDPAHCPTPPALATIDSELTTFLNEIERHLGRPVVLMPSPAIEARYHLAARIARNVWVTGDFREPGSGARGWVLWTANRHLRVPAVSGPVRWVVVQG